MSDELTALKAALHGIGVDGPSFEKAFQGQIDAHQVYLRFSAALSNGFAVRSYLEPPKMHKSLRSSSQKNLWLVSRVC
jgi:hypothetical protein